MIFNSIMFPLSNLIHLDSQQPSETSAIINRITKVKKDYQAKQIAVGKRLASEVLAQHIRETFKSPRNIGVILEPFDITHKTWKAKS